MPDTITPVEALSETAKVDLLACNHLADRLEKMLEATQLNALRVEEMSGLVARLRQSNYGQAVAVLCEVRGILGQEAGALATLLANTSYPNELEQTQFKPFGERIEVFQLLSIRGEI